MSKFVVVALTIAALAPVAAHGAVVVAPSTAVADGFSLTGLIEGTDHVLTSVDDRPAPRSNPLGTGAVAFAATDRAAIWVGGSPRARSAYRSADVASQEPLPEPTTWLMMILGFFGLSFAVRRRSATTGDRVRFS